MKRTSFSLAGLLAVTFTLGLLPPLARGADATSPAPLPPSTSPAAAETKGLDYLLAHQEPSGAWLHQVGPGVTAMVVKALVQSGRPLNDPALKKALDFIETTRQKDGAYFKDSNPNYNSSLVLSAFATVSAAYDAETKKHPPEFDGGAASPENLYPAKIKQLQNYLISLQQVEGKTDSHGNPITKSSPWYGGSGYGEDRPDLSNTAFMIEALHDSGLPPTDPAYQKALVFISRSQMLGSSNDQAFAKGATDGGFIYTPVEGGDSKFGDIDRLEGGSQLRSYGSMTYSGFKSMLFAGLTQDDPRVKACVQWIQSNWTLEYNPGSSSFDGQYYYLHTFAKAMRAWGHNEVTDNRGVKHNWRTELTDFLTQHQSSDGSWVNPKSPRWFEGNPILVTTYSVLSLQEARK